MKGPAVRGRLTLIGAGEHPVDRYSKVGKLVRDRIPQIIREDGADPVTYVAGSQEYRDRLRDKLCEEAAEVLEAADEKAPEELADVLEVVHALAADLGIDTDQLEKIREAKASERGGFAERIVWTGNR
ncbi:nucleoside triphosphate pyrophosphohydrolase [Streptomyces sp. NPDC005576]|uniref:nucleoside triphosphate pyrophosphohydrolase n=1 Tax=unclassified Streptomyces TaxID=2593676 RepID=UPI0033DA7A9E